MEGEEGQQFYQKVISATRDLISSCIWKEANTKTLEKWVSYFKSDDEKVLCALILDSLTFRSSSQTKAIIDHALEQSIPQALLCDGVTLNFDIYRTITARNGKPNRSLRIVPVIREKDPPTKSGPLVARLYKREVGVNEKYMIWPWSVESINEEPSIIVMIDDFVGTGDQFLDFFERFLSGLPAKGDTHFIYAPLGACEQGLERIKRDLPYVSVCCAESIGQRERFFEGMMLRYPGTSLAFQNKMRKTYLELMSRLGLDFIKNKFGYGDLELTYAYAHGTPNATLPILWAETESFQPLLSR